MRGLFRREIAEFNTADLAEMIGDLQARMDRLEGITQWLLEQYHDREALQLLASLNPMAAAKKALEPKAVLDAE